MKRLLTVFSIFSILILKVYSQNLSGFGKIQVVDKEVTREPISNPQLQNFTNYAAINQIISFDTQNLKSLKSYNSSGATGNNSWLTSELPIVVEPSPTASGIINQSQESVDLYTGRLSASIPLYDFKSYDISLPISLTYSTTGVKVDESASWVGLGWSLNAGGCISRVMKGLPDEFEGEVTPLVYSIPAYGYLNINDRDGGVELASFDSYSEDKKNKITKYANWQSIDGLDRGDGFGHGEAWDTQPDEFYFQFGKYSGKFVFSQDGKIKILHNTNLKISNTIQSFTIDGHDIPKIVEFTVIDDDGYKYTFGDASLSSVEQTVLITTRKTVRYSYSFVAEYSFPDNLYGSYLWYRFPQLNLTNNGAGEIVPDAADYICSYGAFTSTWYLREIESPKGDIVTLNYDIPEFGLFYVQSRNESVKLPNVSEIELFDNSQNPPSSIGWFFISPPNDAALSSYKQEVTFSRNEVVIDQRKLSSINCQAGNRIEFKLSENSREDMLGDKSLKQIEIYNCLNEKVKSYEFEYAYNKPSVFKPMTEIHVGSVVNSDGDPVYFSFKEWDDGVNEDLVRSEQKRMLLTKIYEHGGTKVQSKPPYQFEYNNLALPRRTSYKKDKWGYSNANKRGTKIPSISYTGKGGDNVPRSEIPLMIWDNFEAEEAAYLGASLWVNESLAQAGILKKILSPTGGAKEFFYELNEAGEWMVGGLRVKEIRSYPDLNNLSNYVSNEYEYIEGKEVKFRAFQYNLPKNIEGDRDIFASSNSVYNYWTKGGVVGYRSGTKFQTGKGKTIYTFKSPNEISNLTSPVYEVNNELNYNIFPYPEDMDMDWQRGLVEEIRITLDDESKTLNQSNYGYNFAPTNYVENIIYGLIPGIYYYNGFEQYRAGLYSYKSGIYNVEYTETKTFDSKNPGILENAITTQTINEYLTTYLLGWPYIFMSSSTIRSNSGETIQSDFKYPMDMRSEPYVNELISRNIISSKLQESNFKNEVAAGVKKIVLKSEYDIILPGVLEVSKAGILELDPEIVYDRYDDKGNILQVHQKNNIDISYIWAYNQSYPIAKIENFEYDNLNTALNSVSSSLADIQTISMSETDEDDLIALFNELRNITAMKDAQITSYTYDPLKGMRSMTDPNGITTYYIYDDLGRLKQTKDAEGNVLVDYTYQYKEEKIWDN